MIITHKCDITIWVYPSRSESTLEQYIADYTYLIAFLAAIIEGEMILLAVGAAVAYADLSLPLTILIAGAGAFLHDQVLFFVGRHWGKRLLHRFPSFKEKTAHIFELVKKYDFWFIMGFRFVWGLRTPTPIALGLTEICQVKYTGLTFVSAFAWAAVVLLGGHVFGDVAEALLEDFALYQKYVIAGALVIAAGIAVYLYWKRCKGNSA